MMLSTVLICEGCGAINIVTDKGSQVLNNVTKEDVENLVTILGGVAVFREHSDCSCCEGE